MATSGMLTDLLVRENCDPSGCDLPATRIVRSCSRMTPGGQEIGVFLRESAPGNGTSVASTGAVTMRGIRGFSMIELLVTVALVMIASAAAVPLLSGASRRSASFAAQRDVAGQIRTARLAAVTGNKVMQVRFGCPATGQYRVIEITGDATIDADTARCSYPWPDPDAAALPNLDGPIMRLPEGISFGTTQNLAVSTTGQISQLSGSMPVTIQVTNGSTIRQITASAAGRIQTP